ncbi:hypothetical protein ACKTEK_11135 [Tepidamorphus sp. 3E244]|uniref:hypothetical protein n=1 Tax=Tepidamorphus sp. 3E244 TaxID=3385498 RepID=UPI0038FC1BC2
MLNRKMISALALTAALAIPGAAYALDDESTPKVNLETVNPSADQPESAEPGKEYPKEARESGEPTDPNMATMADDDADKPLTEGTREMQAKNNPDQVDDTM